MTEDWKRELKNVKKFKGLNDGWSALGLKSKKAEPPKQLPFPCQHCAQSYSIRPNLASHQKKPHPFLFKKKVPPKNKKTKSCRTHASVQKFFIYYKYTS